MVVVLEYFLLQFPVEAVLGGFFDSLSLIITIYMIKGAINSYSSFMYLAHLSVDLLIACIATMWVLFVFIISIWLTSFLILNPENLLLRKDIYEKRVLSAINNPTGKVRLKIFFWNNYGTISYVTDFTFILIFKIYKNLF